MRENTFNYKRGIFTSWPIWVTKYHDGEPWAAGDSRTRAGKTLG